MKQGKSGGSTTRIFMLLCLLLPALSAGFLYIEHITHIEFLLHVAAIPLEILMGALLVERFLAGRERDRKRQQLMYIKSYLFRSRMRHLFISNFEALDRPRITMEEIRNADLDSLLKLREGLACASYRSTTALEPVIQEYVGAHRVFREFMEWAIANDFESIFQDMIYLLHFIQDIELFKAHHPETSFMAHASTDPALMEKVLGVLRQGLYSFLDYAIELKEKQPGVFDEVLADYQASAAMHVAATGAEDALPMESAAKVT